ncbi:MAG: methylated-DNA--[protein]-cysteine S-methyltransferase [Candidatus Cloacimonetes bacterium]|nr:methylated-DNA--[protein]-cysteine S-methyltransferase [Candidatus Cloacimonadota bacterium]MCF7815328.1 methylated-DNA--[protein]-cysteine S-methyltransferase [Candidatus Cloacimonadota bacterium]MCF7869120.1 methylated-DNA--[protein]-cysteine S-methyltransferase [Candidatus Cloacimonadota bacterium]MCF7884543.1 methylated-DNA--[protein]-cysteine S-methyltransferase [Candidatus Cloacimonadota bacterium]
MIYSKTIDSPIGKLGLYADKNYLLRITFCEADEFDRSNTILDETETQVQEYFLGKRKQFDLPLKLEGTDFQKQVWTELKKIAFGTKISYQELASRVGSIKKARAVGTANHYNPIPIIIPCHRVVRKNGELGGFAGGLDVKRFLLDLESSNVLKSDQA